MASKTRSVASFLALRRAIVDGDAAALTIVPGVGKKTAERMVLELAEKAASFAAEPAPEAPAAVAAEDVVSALVNLGYQRAAAEKALGAVSKNGQFDTILDLE